MIKKTKRTKGVDGECVPPDVWIGDSNVNTPPHFLLGKMQNVTNCVSVYTQRHDFCRLVGNYNNTVRTVSAYACDEAAVVLNLFLLISLILCT